jgi:uncharacterized cupin superfamily protein
MLDPGRRNSSTILRDPLLQCHAFERYVVAMIPERVLLHVRSGKTMTKLKPPAANPNDLEARTTSGYPEPYRSRVLPREKRALGDALGLTKIGVNLTTLMPGKESSMRHFHTHEDELVYVLEGEIVLCTDDGEQLLTPGTYAGFPAGKRNGHHFINRSDRPARYLEISNRDPNDGAEYTDPEVDLAYRCGPNGKAVFTRRDGSSF